MSEKSRKQQDEFVEKDKQPEQTATGATGIDSTQVGVTAKATPQEPGSGRKQTTSPTRNDTSTPDRETGINSDNNGPVFDGDTAG